MIRFMKYMMHKNKGCGLVALGIFAILVWAVFQYLWLIGIILILVGLIWWLVGKKK